MYNLFFAISGISFAIFLYIVTWVMAAPIRLLIAWTRSRLYKSDAYDRWRTQHSTNAASRLRNRFGLYYIPASAALFILMVILVVIASLFLPDQDARDQFGYTTGLIYGFIIFLSPIAVIPASYIIEYYINTNRVISMRSYLAALCSVLALPLLAALPHTLALENTYDYTADTSGQMTASQAIELAERTGQFSSDDTDNACTAYLNSIGFGFKNETGYSPMLAPQSVDDLVQRYWINEFLRGITVDIYDDVFGCTISPLAVNEDNYGMTTLSYVFRTFVSTFALAVIVGPILLWGARVAKRIGARGVSSSD